MTAPASRPALPGRRFRLGPASAVVADVRVALGQGPGTPDAIWKRVNCWAPATIRQALQDLVTLGEATYEGPTGYRVYRKAA